MDLLCLPDNLGTLLWISGDKLKFGVRAWMNIQGPGNLDDSVILTPDVDLHARLGSNPGDRHAFRNV
jgi:hypothetical protein